MTEPLDPLTPAERLLLSGEEVPDEPGASDALRERWRGLRAIAAGCELDAAASFRRAREACQQGSAAWAVNERLYGLALIRALREVEGTFALERADAILDALGLDRFTLDD
ncbi:MAG TPA: hypothetical protein VNT60_03025 [Deinococcales bacterium]|nr:hypothetical protein [Deinococcales bacterium]